MKMILPMLDNLKSELCCIFVLKSPKEKYFPNYFGPGFFRIIKK